MRLSAQADETIRKAALNAGAVVLEPREWLCTAGVCPVTDSEGEPLYVDGYHLRADFVRLHLRALDFLATPDLAASAVAATTTSLGK
jgi:hypothetical protein